MTLLWIILLYRTLQMLTAAAKCDYGLENGALSARARLKLDEIIFYFICVSRRYLIARKVIRSLCKQFKIVPSINHSNKNI